MTTAHCVVDRDKPGLFPLAVRRRPGQTGNAVHRGRKVRSFPLQGAGIVLASGAGGWMAWGGDAGIWPLLWVLVLPLSWAMASSRWVLFCSVLAYYLMGARGLPGGTAVFFGEAAPTWLGVVLWVLASAILALPHALAWSGLARLRGWRCVGATCMSAIPPMAIIGWLNPLTASGVMFPGQGWLGLAAMATLIYAIASKRWVWAALLSAGALCLNLHYAAGSTRSPVGWAGIDTQFAKLSSGGHDDSGQILSALRRAEWLGHLVTTLPAQSVAVLPETLLGRFDAVMEGAVAATAEALKQRGSRVIVGAEIPLADGSYQNAMVVLGAAPEQHQIAVQGIPVPIGMWRPWDTNGAQANLWSRGPIIEILGERVAVAICYEQLLTFSMLRLFASKPTILIAPSNVWWAKATSIPAIQNQSVFAFGRLFSVPVIIARNI